MKDQHKKIKGYRDLNQDEIDLINEIKEHAEQTKMLLKKLEGYRQADPLMGVALTDEQKYETGRCQALAKTNLQQGYMWFIRAVALPDSF